MKWITAFISGLLLLVSLTACTTESYSTYRSFEMNTSKKMSMRYEKFDGHKDRTLSIKEPTNVNVIIESLNGKLGLSIQDDNGHRVYEGNDLPTSSFTVHLEQVGKYRINVDADHHEGSFELTWDTNQTD